jgi:hypothetical protein
MNAVQQKMSAMAAMYGPGPTELREQVAAGLGHGVDLSRELVDLHACEQLICQLTGVIRTCQRLGAVLASEANHDAHT